MKKKASKCCAAGLAADPVVAALHEMGATKLNVLADEFQTISMDEFREQLLCRLFKAQNYDVIPRYQLTNEDWCIIEADYLPKYQDWDWNYGASPRFEYNRDQHFAAGTIEFSLQID